MDKDELVEKLEKHYGENWKTPLSKDLGVNVSTIRRVFNQRDDIPLVYLYAIEKLLIG